MSVGDSVRGAVSRVPSAAGIGQDDIIFAMLTFAFVVWITTKGELPIYLAFFKPGTGAQGPTPIGVTASSTTGSSAAAAATNAVFGSPNIPNPGLLGGANPVGALTANPSTFFGALPTLQAIPGALQNNLLNPILKFFGGGS